MGTRSWPPVWCEIYARKKWFKGEFGVLTKAVEDPDPQLARCYLYITYDKEPYLGTLLFDDRAFCRAVANLLQSHIGDEIEKIGDLDMSHTL